MTITTLIFTSSCNKCDEFAPGDCKGCYEKLAGDWTLNYLATSGIDSVTYYNSLFATSCLITFKLYEKKNDGQGFIITWGDTSANYFFHGGEYSHITDDGYLSVPYYSSSATSTVTLNPFSAWLPVPVPALNSWKINKLSDIDLWFELDRNGNIYEMHLSK